jgi:hypothetical protein
MHFAIGIGGNVQSDPRASPMATPLIFHRHYAKAGRNRIPRSGAHDIIGISRERSNHDGLDSPGIV